MEVGAILQAVVGALMLAFVPGWMWSRVLLPAAGWPVRAVASIALSLAMMVVALYLGSTIAGIAVSGVHALWWSVLLTLAGWAIHELRRPAPTSGP